MLKAKKFLIIIIIIVSLCFSFSGFNHKIETSYAQTIISLIDSVYLENLDEAGTDFGINTKGSCAAVAGGILIQYLDKNYDNGFIPSDYNNWINACDNAGDIAVIGQTGYDVSINSDDSIYEALHKYLIAISGVTQFGMSNINFLNSLFNYKNNKECFGGISLNYKDDNNNTHEAILSDIKEQIGNNNPVAAFIDYQGEYHVVVIYGYDEYNNLYYHTGWNDITSTDVKENLGSCNYLNLESIFYYNNYSLINHDFNNHIYQNENSHLSYCVYCEQQIVKNHVYTYSTYNSTQHNKTCTLCNYNILENHNISFINNFDGTHNKICNTCNYTVTNLIHRYTIIVSTNSTTHTLKCVCNNLLYESHIWVYKRTYYQCSKCGKTSTSGGGTQ